MSAESQSSSLPERMPKAPSAPRRSSGLYYFLTFIIVGCLYFFITWAFYAPDVTREYFPLSPIQCVSPAICLFFGWPAILGCMAADAILLSVVMGLGPELFWISFGAEIFYDAFPYIIWYVVYHKSSDPFPRLDSASKLTAFLLLITASTLVWALLVSSTVYPVYVTVFSPESYWRLAFFVVYVFGSVFGIFVLLAFDRCPAEPICPPQIKVAYRRKPRMTLTQRLIVAFSATVMFLVMSLLIGYADYFTPESSPEDIADTLTSCFLYGGESALAVWIFVVFFLWYLESRFTRPLELLAHNTRQFPEALATYQKAEESKSSKEELTLAKDKAEEPLALGNLEPSGEVADLIADTDEMRASLVNYLDELKDVTAENERVRAELDIASQIQLGAVPHDFTDLSKRLSVEVAASMTPAREVGGDFYDAFALGPQKLGVIMADVSGKGMPAALFMMRALASIRERMLAIADIGEALTEANKSLCENNEAMLFVTAFVCVLDVTTGELAYANAGHNPAWRLGPAGDWVSAKPGLVLGVMDMVRYKTETLQFAPKEGLFLYTDGVTEAMNPVNDLYGEKRLGEVLLEEEAKAHGEATSEAVVDAVLKDVEVFVNGAPQSDDLTALAFRWLPSQ